MCTSLSLALSLSIYIYTYMCHYITLVLVVVIHIYIYIEREICTYTLHVYIYIYIYTYMYVYIYIYIYMYYSICLSRPLDAASVTSPYESPNAALGSATGHILTLSMLFVACYFVVFYLPIRYALSNKISSETADANWKEQGEGEM